MKSLATINFKGGVGKTTVTWCLGDVLSNIGHSNVLIFDLDAQMSLTQAIAVDPDGNSLGKFDRWYKKARENDRTVLSVLRRYLNGSLNDFHPDNGFIYRLTENYHFVPAVAGLYWLEIEKNINVDSEKGKFFIKNLLGRIENSPNLPKYDYVLFDCPPSFTMLSHSVLTCCDFLLIPFKADFFAADGINLLVEGLRQKIQPHPLPNMKVFANQVKTWRGPTKAANRWMDSVREECVRVGLRNDLDVQYMKTWIPDRAALRDAITNYRTPREWVDTFQDLWTEILKE